MFLAAVDWEAEAAGGSQSQEHVHSGKITLGTFYQEHLCAFSWHHSCLARLWYLGCSQKLDNNLNGSFCEFSPTSQMNSAKLLFKYKKF